MVLPQNGHLSHPALLASNGFKVPEAPRRGEVGCREEQCLERIKGQGSHSLLTSINQEAGYVMATSRMLLASCLSQMHGAFPGLSGHEDDGCILRWLEVFPKCLQEEGRQGRRVTSTALVVLLS